MQEVWAGATKRILSSSRCFFLLNELRLSPFHLNYCYDCTSLQFTLHAPNTPIHPRHTDALCGTMTQQVSAVQQPKWMKAHLKDTRVFCVLDFAGNRGLRVTGYDNGKCERWERWKKHAGSAQLSQLSCVPTKQKKKHPWVAAGIIRRGLFIQAKKSHVTPGARDVISEWNYGCWSVK